LFESNIRYLENCNEGNSLLFIISEALVTSIQTPLTSKEIEELIDPIQQGRSLVGSNKLLVKLLKLLKRISTFTSLTNSLEGCCWIALLMGVGTAGGGDNRSGSNSKPGEVGVASG